jgi:hypothetical protein
MRFVGEALRKMHRRGGHLAKIEGVHSNTAAHSLIGNQVLKKLEPWFQSSFDFLIQAPFSQ